MKIIWRRGLSKYFVEILIPDDNAQTSSADVSVHVHLLVTVLHIITSIKYFCQPHLDQLERFEYQDPFQSPNLCKLVPEKISSSVKHDFNPF